MQNLCDVFVQKNSSSKRELGNRPDFLHPSATQAQPAQNESGQVIENLPAFLTMVPKAGLEPARA
jgi:hypothetical protein